MPSTVSSLQKNNEMKANIIILAIALICGSSCVKQQMELTYAKQEDKIDSYVKSRMASSPDATLTRNKGTNRITLVQGEGEALTESGIVAITYSGYSFSGSISQSNLFATNDSQVAESASWQEPENGFEPLMLDMKNDQMLEGLRNGLLGVKAGEECEILFSGKYAFGKKPFGIIPANSALAFKIKIEGLSNN